MSQAKSTWAQAIRQSAMGAIAGIQDPSHPLTQQYARHVIRVHQIAADSSKRCQWTRRLAAVHEAGHCAGFHRLGMRIQQVCIERDQEGRWGGMTHPLSKWHEISPESVAIPGCRAEALDRATVTLMGPMAEILFAFDDWGYDSASDEIMLVTLLAGTVTDVTGESKDAVYNAVAARAVRWLYEARQPLLRLADVIEARRKLRSHEMRAILAACPVGREVRNAA